MRFTTYTFLFLFSTLLSLTASFAEEMQSTEPADSSLQDEGPIAPCCTMPEGDVADGQAVKPTTESLAADAMATAETILTDARKKAESMMNEVVQARNALDKEKAELAASIQTYEENAALLKQKASDIANSEAQLNKNSEQFAAAKAQLDNTAKQLEALEASLKQREADLMKNLKMLESEKTSLQDKQLKFEARSKAQDDAAAKRMKDPEALALEIFNAILPKDRVSRMQDELMEVRQSLIESAGNAKPIQARLGKVAGEFQSKIEETFDYQSIKKDFLKQFTETYSPQELLELADFYNSKLGQKLVTQASNLNENIAASLLHKASELSMSFQGTINSLTSDEAVEGLITGNLELISKAGKSYMLDNGVKEVRFTTLLNEGLIKPVIPIAGESYAKLKIQSTGGVLSVRTSDGDVVSYSY